MLFPEVAGVAAFNINVMDTIFYSPFDNTPSYIYTDSKRGLTSIKNKNNFSELFLRRKQDIDENAI